MAHVTPLPPLTGALHRGPYRAPGIRVGDREPITDGGRVMWGLEWAVDYNSSPDIGHAGPSRQWLLMTLLVSVE